MWTDSDNGYKAEICVISQYFLSVSLQKTKNNSRVNQWQENYAIFDKIEWNSF